jgi:hypothetical protein
MHQVNLMHMDPVIVASAGIHGISDSDMLHAYRNPIRVFQIDALVMLIAGDESGRMLESGVAATEGIEFIVHATPAREKFLR